MLHSGLAPRRRTPINGWEAAQTRLRRRGTSPCCRQPARHGQVTSVNLGLKPGNPVARRIRNVQDDDGLST